MQTSANAIAVPYPKIREFEKLFYILALLASLFLTSCEKDDDHTSGNTPGKGVVRPVGTPQGNAVTKEIGPEGGTIAAEDGSISILIPEGALAEKKTISIQPITNTNPTGKKAFRLTPHGNVFKKEVKITFTYTPQDISRTIPEGLGIAFQDTTGVWRSMGGIETDKAVGKISVTTNHFSDWSFFEKFWIDPVAASVELGKMVDLKVMAIDPDITAPMPKGETRGLDEPYEVKESFIKEWNLDGEGILGGMKNFQTYQAPDKMPAKNPVAVSVELNLPEPGKFLLVCNIMVGNPPFINYLQVDEEHSQLFIYGSGFLQGDATNAQVTVDGVPVKGIVMMSDVLIQCWIPETGKGSSGPVQVIKNGASSNKHVLNEWNGTFVYNRPCAGNAGSLYQKIVFSIRLRGDADPDLTKPMKLDPFKNRSRLNSGSKAKYEAGGVGNTSYNNEDGCGKDHVQYANTEGYAPFVSNYNADIQTFFTGEIETKVSGFDLRLDFVAPQITPAHYVYTPCKGDGYTEDYNDEIYFMFSSYNDVLKLLFKDNSSLTGGSMKGNAGVAKNIHFNVWDVPANIVDATLTWGEIPAKYPNGTVIE